MNDLKKSKQQLIDELEALRLKVAELDNRPGAREPDAERPVLPEVKLERIFDALPDMIAIVDSDYVVVKANRAMSKHIDKTLGEARRVKCFHAIHGQETPVDNCPHGKALLYKKACTAEIYSETMKEHFLETATPVINDSGHMVGSVIVLRNISAEKKTQEALRESEESMKSVLRVAPVGIGVVNNRVLQWTSGQFSEMTGYSPEEARGRSVRILYADEDEFERVGSITYKQMQSVGVAEIQTRWRRKDGRIIDVLLRSTPFSGRDVGKGVTFTALDITDHQKAESRIRRSLREKETLLQEIHHRVKNNMTIIKSLLNQQARKIEDQSLRDLFRESQARIASMALIHESLYQSENLTAIDLKSYVSKLGANLIRMYGMSSRNISVSADSDGVTLGMEQAVPCGLLISELMTNAFKYAFPDGRRGEIRIIAQGAEKENVKIVISDNGVGIPLEVDIHEAKTLGFHLVTSLVEIQLQGSIKLERSGGARFTIRFDKKADSARCRMVPDSGS